jgi:CPA2 family monovalent cation:H+ antiporter-2/glutathione-regulated potassium-efflux system protein KefB
MSEPGFFQSALVYLLAAVVSVPVAKRLGLGSVLGYLVAGCVIGPHALGWVGGGERHEGVMHVAESGVVVMLFLIGLELRLPALWKMKGALLGLGGSQVLFTGLALGAGAMLAGFDVRQAFVAGFILSLSSTAIVLQSLREKGLHTSAGGRHAFATLLFQDLAVIPMLAVLPLLAAKVPEGAAAATGPLADLPSWVRGLAVPAAIVGVVLAGRWLSPPLFGYIARSGLREIFTATALLLVLAIGALMSVVGLSPALGAFLGGVVLAGSPYRHELESDLEPFKGLLLGLFFISVGASMDLALVAGNPVRMALLLAGFVAIKGLVLVALGKAFRFGGDQTALYSLAMFQGGEFAFVLSNQTAGMGILPGPIAAELNAVVALSMALTPLALLLFQKRFARTHESKAASHEADPVAHKSAVILAGFGRFGNFVGRLLRAQGFQPVVLESDAEHVELTRRLGLEVHYGDATRPEVLHAAGAAEARLLVIAIDDEQAIDRLVSECRHHFPDLQLLVRAVDMDHRLRLLNAGVEHVFHEMAGSAIDAGAQALRLLGLPAYTAERSARRFRRYDISTARELAPHQADRETYISLVRDRVDDLEKLFSRDPMDSGNSDGAAWDPPYATGAKSPVANRNPK